jgi:hypothetical protein
MEMGGERFASERLSYASHGQSRLALMVLVRDRARALAITDALRPYLSRGATSYTVLRSTSEYPDGLMNAKLSGYTPDLLRQSATS